MGLWEFVFTARGGMRSFQRTGSERTPASIHLPHFYHTKTSQSTEDIFLGYKIHLYYNFDRPYLFQEVLS